MPEYVLYYWPVPFRGEFVRAVLAHAGVEAEEPDADIVDERMRAGDQPDPFMAPPLLEHRASGEAMAQMPAILGWLGYRHGLLPEGATAVAMAIKVVLDCNDVIDEITRQGGLAMWDEVAWETFSEDRLPRWLGVFEATGRQHGLTPEAGFILGTDAPTIADLAAAVCWGTMADRLPPLRAILDANAPALAGLVARIEALPEQAARIEASRARFGSSYCGGRIEASLREVLGIATRTDDDDDDGDDEAAADSDPAAAQETGGTGSDE